jgi:PPM family protein phosphatase
MPRAAARTHPGRVRLTNEDVPVLDATRGVFGVVDGIGGHAGGEVAAAMAKDVILQRLARPLGTPAERAREAIAIANNTIFRRATDCPELAGMACVITLALVGDGRLTIGHVGDTRLYKLRVDGIGLGLGIRKLTRDHSPVGEREDAGELSEAEAMRHPHRNEVFRDVGTIFRDKDEQEFVDIIEEPLEPDAAILVCSDGLSDMLPAASIAHIVRQHAGDPEAVVEALIAAANDAGGRDNITAVYAEMPRFAGAVADGIDQRETPTEPPTVADTYRIRGSVGSQSAQTSGQTGAQAAIRSVAEMQSAAQTAARSGAQSAAHTDSQAAMRSLAESQADAQATARPGSRAAAGAAVQTARAPAAAGLATAGVAAARAASAGPSWISRAARAFVSSRLTWFAVGAFAGVAGAIALTGYVARLQIPPARTLIVAPAAQDAGAGGGLAGFATISAALLTARPGDVVRVEPGTYREQVQLPDGVDLIARVPGTVTIVPPSTPAVAITGPLNVRVSGIRIEPTADAPVDTGVYITAPTATLELVEMTGPIRHGFSLSPASALIVRGSRISVSDTLIAVPDDGHATFVNSVLTRAGTGSASAGSASGAALSMTPSAHLVLRGNVFAGFGSHLLDDVTPAQRAELLAGNIVVPAEEHAGAATAAPAAGSAPSTRRRGTTARQVPESGR